MKYLTFKELENESTNLNKSFEINEGMKKTASRKKNVFVFLSQRYKDKSIVKNVIGFLRRFNSVCYVDWMDKNMPEKTNSETANIIKEKIDSSNKFILLATPKSIKSIWIPWELGLGDAKKGIENVAILPLLVFEDHWAEREYYQIYGKISKTDSGKWCYFPPDSTNEIPLRDWLLNEASLEDDDFFNNY